VSHDARQIVKNGLVRAIKALRLAGPYKEVARHLDGPDPKSRFAQLRPNGRFFVDGKNRRHELVDGLRDLVKPGWRNALKPLSELPAPTEADLRKKLAGAREAVDRMMELLLIAGVRKPKRILEIGCFDGAKSFALAERFDAPVIASDITAYYVRQDTTADKAPGEVPVDNFLSRLREGIRAHSTAGSRVQFVEDDIAHSTLDSGAFDLVVSWEVLEHLGDPGRSFGQIHRLLSPGGIAWHEYNPFFCIEGGHSLCTLDFLWGHSQVDAEDFRRYAAEFRADEGDAGLRFFTDNLNRMTLHGLRALHAGLGFQELAILLSTKNWQASLVTTEILNRCRELHPTATLTDLLTPIVVAVHRKAAS
jgi:SAM-dependent methyltransferase